MKLGIDFGTTRTVVACADRGNYPIVSFYDEAGDAHDGFPSVVSEREGELSFGFEALAADLDRGATVRSFKRLLADAQSGKSKVVRIGDVELSLDELVTRFLKATKEAVLHRSNVSADRVDEVQSVAAVPANASGAQRFVTLDAFRRAGLNPIAMLNEPSAAGFEYTHRHRDTLSSRRDHVVVYDLGGGTFDASLVRMRGRSHEVVATAGVNHLGGDDFDSLLAELVLERAGRLRTDLTPAELGQLLDQCRDAKERLNPSSRKISIDLESVFGARASKSEIVVPVADYYDACAPLIERSIEAMTPVMNRLAGGAPLEEIAGIYVVGGASELPVVARALRQRFGRRVFRSPYPSAAIAIGLAIACDEKAGFELSDRYTRTFGVFRESHAGAEITFDPIFTHDMELPSASGAAVRFRRDYRAAHNVGHFRFVECNAVTDDGRPRGDIMVSGSVLFPFDPRLDGAVDLAEVPVERLDGRGPRVEEEYALDQNGLVAVTIKNLDSGLSRVYRLGSAA